MRLVLDANVVVSGTLWNGAPSRLIDQVKLGRAKIVSSPILLEELADVLFREKLANKFVQAGTTPEDVLREFIRECELVEATGLATPMAPDPDDDWVIATALAAKAELIVTGDKALLGVGSVGAIRIVGVAEALELLGAG